MEILAWLGLRACGLLDMDICLLAFMKPTFLKSLMKPLMQCSWGAQSEAWLHSEAVLCHGSL